jgi:hypothetical protein
VADEYTERSIFIEEQMKDLIGKMEKYGEEGKVTEASEIMKQVDELKREQERIMRQKEANPILKQEKRMEVCEVCGALLIAGDPQHRLESHFEGRQHLGYMKLRETYEKLKEDFERRRGNGQRDIDSSRHNNDRRKHEQHRRHESPKDRYGSRDHHSRHYKDKDESYRHRREQSRETSPSKSRRHRSRERDSHR